MNVSKLSIDFQTQACVKREAQHYLSVMSQNTEALSGAISARIEFALNIKEVQELAPDSLVNSGALCGLLER